MSILNSYIQKEAELKRLKEEIAAMERDERLQTDMQFRDQLNTLMANFEKSSKDVIALLDPDYFNRNTSESQKPDRKKRRTKVYTNPHNGEVIKARSGNHKGLKAWKAEYGNDTVESWVVVLED